MTPKTPYELFMEFWEKHKSSKLSMDLAKDEIRSWLRITELFNFQLFKLSEDCHAGLKPVAISGGAHSWSVLYDDKESSETPGHIQIYFNTNSQNNIEECTVITAELTYHSTGSVITAKIPLSAVKSFDAFKAWYKEQVDNYISNFKVIKEKELAKEKLKQSPEFAKWVEEGRQFFDNGFVSISMYGRQILEPEYEDTI